MKGAKMYELSGRAECVDWSDIAKAGRAYADNLLGEPAVSKVMHAMADEIERLRNLLEQREQSQNTQDQQPRTKEAATMSETDERSVASTGSGEDGTGEKGFLRCSVEFDIDGHKVESSHSYDYQSRPGLSSMGWVWGLNVGEVLLSLRPHMNGKQWSDFVEGIQNQFDEYE